MLEGAEERSLAASMKKALLAGVALLVLCLAGAAAWYRWAPRQSPAGQPALVQLGEQDFAAFERAFNEAAGSVRVLLLLSPT